MMVKKTVCGGLAAGLIFISGPGLGGSEAEGQEHAVAPGKKNDRPLPVPENPRAATERETAVGTQEVPRPDGGRDKIYFSVTPESERRAREQAEREKMEKALDLPRNIIILGPGPR
jgi:hypothetical protein